MSVTYFISDLHLSADRQDINDCLFHFLQTEAVGADALYILGDLFEVWIGDDNITPFSESIAAALKNLSTTVPIYFIHGNRDFATNFAHVILRIKNFDENLAVGGGPD